MGGCRKGEKDMNDVMNDVIVQFARLWGRFKRNIRYSDMLKAYDSKEMLNVISGWAEDFLNSDEEDTCEFFYKKVETLLLED